MQDSGHWKKNGPDFVLFYFFFYQGKYQHRVTRYLIFREKWLYGAVFQKLFSNGSRVMYDVCRISRKLGNYLRVLQSNIIKNSKRLLCCRY